MTVDVLVGGAEVLVGGAEVLVGGAGVLVGVLITTCVGVGDGGTCSSLECGDGLNPRLLTATSSAKAAATPSAKRSRIHLSGLPVRPDRRPGGAK